MKYSIAGLFIGCLYFCTLSELNAKVPDFVYTHCCYNHEEPGAIRGVNYCPGGWGKFTKLENCQNKGGFVPK